MVSDDRVPVRMGDVVSAGPGEALLIEGDAPAPPGATVARFRLGAAGGHRAGCACCRTPGAAAEALARLYVGRARGDVAWFRAVVAVPETVAGQQAIATALQEDRLVVGRFRAAPQAPCASSKA
jgi:hypothetical protein